MDKKSQEDKFKAVKLPELKFYLQNRGITANSYLKPGHVASYSMCRRRNESSSAPSNQ